MDTTMNAKMPPVGRQRVRSTKRMYHTKRLEMCQACGKNSRRPEWRKSIGVHTETLIQRCSQNAQYQKREGILLSASSSSPPPLGVFDVGEEVKRTLLESEERARYLETLVSLRTLYRSLLRARYWLNQPHPVMASHPAASTSSSIEEEESLRSMSSDVDEDEELAWALDAIAEMALTSDQLRDQLRNLPFGFGAVLVEEVEDPKKDKGAEPMQGPLEREQNVKNIGGDLLSDLTERVEKELGTLPFNSRKEALRAVRQRITNELEEDSEEEDNAQHRSILNSERGYRRVRRAEKAAERFVERVRASSKGMLLMQNSDSSEYIQGLAGYARDVWVRLNGGGRASLDSVPLPEGLPRPAKILVGRNMAYETGVTADELSIQVDKLDKELREASKARENKLRKAGVLERARMASDLRGAEEKVSILRSQLALRTLQLEMRLVFNCLENEALQIVEEDRTFLPMRRGSSEELTLLVAEYELLDLKLAQLSGNTASMLADENELLKELTVDVPDLRMRLGITDDKVINLSLDARVKNLVIVVEDSTNKVKDGFVFMGIGVKLLVTDLVTCGKLFWRAVLGSTLQPREVETLRRTARDLLTFVPFVVILILPITPVGHVLVFSFIQQNFPSLFPTQFTSSRQKSMKRYDLLKKQLDEVQMQEGYKWREEQFRKAVAAVEELTSNVSIIADKEALKIPEDLDTDENAGVESKQDVQM